MSRIGRDYEWQKARARVLAGAQWCAICGRPLDFAAPPRSRWAPSVDHVLPVSRTRGMTDPIRRRLATDPAGLRAVHYGCNAKRGNGRKRPVHISRRWL
jgi:hypothetical protein